MCRAIASWHVSFQWKMNIVGYKAFYTSLYYLFTVCVSCQVIRSEDLHNEVSQVLQGFKQVPFCPITYWNIYPLSLQLKNEDIWPPFFSLK